MSRALTQEQALAQVAAKERRAAVGLDRRRCAAILWNDGKERRR